MSNTEWMKKAACLKEDPELFFPIGSGAPVRAQIDEAKIVCGKCAVSTQCLGYALEVGYPVGIWGGLTEDERKPLRRMR